VTVYLRGRLIATVRRRNFAVRIAGSDLRPGPNRVKTIVTDAEGRKVTARRTIRPCGRRARLPQFTG